MKAGTANKGKLILYGVAGLAAVGIVYGIYHYVTREKTEFTLPGSSKSSSTPKPTFPLREGSSGKEVESLQKYINSLIPIPVAPLKVDGDFGPKTLAAAKKYLGMTEFPLSYMQAVAGVY